MGHRSSIMVGGSGGLGKRNSIVVGPSGPRNSVLNPSIGGPRSSMLMSQVPTVPLSTARVNYTRFHAARTRLGLGKRVESQALILEQLRRNRVQGTYAFTLERYWDALSAEKL